MIFRFTLTHAIEGTKVISEPDGWESSTIGFERHSDFHSLIEYFKSSFNAYGSNGTEDGGRAWLLNVEKLHGQDSEIDLLVEVDELEHGDFEELYTGQIAISMFVETLDDQHLLQIVFTQKTFWTKFISRFKNKVNIKSTVSESGVTVPAAAEVDLPLPSQVINKNYLGLFNKSQSLIGFGDDPTTINGKYGGIDQDSQQLDEIESRFSLPTGVNPDLPAWQFAFTESGVYDFDIRFEVSMMKDVLTGFIGYTRTRTFYSVEQSILDASLANASLDYYFQLNNGTPILFSASENVAASRSTSFIFLSSLLNINKGDIIRVYAVFTNNLYIIDDSACIGLLANFSSRYTKWLIYGNEVTACEIPMPVITSTNSSCNPPAIDIGSIFDPVNQELNPINFPSPPSGNTVNPSYFSILARTTVPDTTAKAFLTHDVMAAIVDRITDQEDLFYSEYLGNAETSIVYGAEGCGSLLANVKGLHIRGYTLTAKPFFNSAEEWWHGINPIHNLGLGYEKVSGLDVIRVERKEHFYDDSAPLVYLSNVYNIKRTYDLENHFNQVEIGYDKWQSQASTGTGTSSGIDDPQTRHTYNSRFKKIGKKITLFSKWVAASLTLETTRRTSILKSANYTYDDETFVIALKNNGDGTFNPELDENFSTLTNLLNKETRYNSRLTPGRNLLRWANYLSGCLQSYIGSVFKFASGEGNFDMTSQMSTSCLGDSTLLDEKGDITVNSDFLFIPMPYEINHYLTWAQYKLIRDNKNLAIGISQTEADYKKFFIKTLEYQIGTGLIKLVAWPKEPFDLRTIDFIEDRRRRYYEDTYESQYE